jgi:hypothetical protein
LSYGQAKNDQTETLQLALEQQPLHESPEHEQSLAIEVELVSLSEQLSVQPIPVGFQPFEVAFVPIPAEEPAAVDRHFGRAAG